MPSTSAEDNIIHFFYSHHLTLSCAESCTGGLVSKRLTDIPGASSVFRGGIVVYTNDVKENILRVPAEIIRKYTAVSHETAVSMAENCRILFHTDFAISVTGVAGPGKDIDGNPEGLCYLGISSVHGTFAEKYVFSGNRESIRSKCADTVLFMLFSHCSSVNVTAFHG